MIQESQVGVYLKRLTTAYIAAGVLSLAALKAKALTPSGAAGATLVGGTIWGCAPPRASLGLITFFTSSSALTQLPSGTRGRDEGGRNAAQVLANGGVASALAVDWVIRRSPVSLAAIGGALAAATADTWASELGVRYGGTPRLITTLNKVPPGANGGVTAVGIASSLMGATVISAIYTAAFRGQNRRQLFLATTAAGTLASLVDSLLGATIESRPNGGVHWIDNDAVNLLNTTTGAGLAALLYRYSP